VVDVDAVETRWESAGKKVILRPGRNDLEEAVGYQRGHLNSPGLSGVHWHPKDVGLIVETAQHVPPQRWMYAGVEWEQEPRRVDVATGFCGAEIVADHPETMAETWASGLGAALGTDGTSVLLGVSRSVNLSPPVPAQRSPTGCEKSTSAKDAIESSMHVANTSGNVSPCLFLLRPYHWGVLICASSNNL
jgi:hypothetical protein